MIRRLPLVLLLVLFAPVSALPAEPDPLPSWNPGPARGAIIDFVSRVTREGGPDFVPVPERIATFDNDGTLWCEQPAYVQAIFIRDRIRAMAPGHPDWKVAQPFKAIIEGDQDTLAALGGRGLAELVAVTHGGMTNDDFQMLVRDWIALAKHPRFDRPYTACVYQPMLELLAYLRASGFKTFIVSGGGVDFMRAWTERVYGIPPEQVVGSTIGLKYELRDDRPVIYRLPQVEFIDDRDGKAIGISRSIGRKPIAAFGNSDGDYEMLRYTTAAPGPRLGLIVHHTDAAREYAYDRNSPVGRLSRALDEAPGRGWIVLDMKTEWRTVFPPLPAH
jgi:phosphoglycolate phosphatase-like HAD superfamily hydrolase